MKGKFRVYIIITRKNGTSYKRTKAWCDTQSEAEKKMSELISQTGKFHSREEAEQ